MTVKILIGEKAGMSQVYAEDGKAVPVTAIESPDCIVVMKREVNGEPTVQLGFEQTDKLNKPETGHFEKHGVEPRRILAEFSLEAESPLLEMEQGDSVGVDQFEEGELVDVQGRTKGRGFQGVVKRWDFAGGPASHGGKFGRRTGSVGQSATPSRIFKGKKMPGRYGNDVRTMQNLEVVRVFADENVLLVKGSIPGPDGGTVLIHSTHKGAKTVG